MFRITKTFVWRNYCKFWQIIRRLDMLLKSREIKCVYNTPPSGRTIIKSRRIRPDSYQKPQCPHATERATITVSDILNLIINSEFLNSKCNIVSTYTLANVLQEIHNYISGAKFTDKNFYVFAKLQGKKENLQYSKRN